MDIHIGQLLQKKLQSLGKESSTGAVISLFGWRFDSRITCVGYTVSPEFTQSGAVQDLDKLLEPYPAGLLCVGIYIHSEEKDGALSDATSLCRKLMSGLKEQEEEENLCILIQEKNGGLCTGYIYTDYQDSASPAEVTVVDLEEINSNISLFRVQGALPLSYELPLGKGDGDEDALGRAVNSLIQQVLSPVTAFYMENSSVVLCNQIDFRPSPTLGEDASCGEFVQLSSVDIEEDDGFGSLQTKKKRMDKTQKDPIKLKLLFQVTGDSAIKRTVSCQPIIHYERREFENINAILPIDVIATVPSCLPLVKLPAILMNGISKQLCAIKTCLSEFGTNNNLPCVKVFHFRPMYCDHLVTAVYPITATEDELAPCRRALHQMLLLPMDRPLFRRANCIAFAEDRLKDSYLLNTHIGLPNSGVQDGTVSLVQGIYTYHHYMQDRVNDNGWGCAYRSLQTIVSWYRHQGYTSRPVPSHTEIQEALVAAGDKPAAFIGTRKWIGSMEVNFCLMQLIGVDSKIMNVSSGAEMGSKGRELANHFNTQGTPVMIGGGVLAHTIIGIHFNEKTGALKFLILDPHYTGSEDLSIIQNKGWCGWKGIEFWDQTAYYNMCLPQRPIEL